MQHEDHHEKIAVEMDKQWPQQDLPEAKKLDFHCKLAWELLAEESDNVKASLEEELEVEHDEEVQAHKVASLGLPSDDPEDQAEWVLPFVYQFNSLQYNTEPDNAWLR